MKRAAGSVAAILSALADACGGCGGGGAATATGGGTVPSGLAFQTIAAGFSSPVHLTHAGDGSGRLFVVEQAGHIRIVNGGVVMPGPFLDISARVLSGGEQGLLSVAFPPGYAAKRYFYVNYTRVPDGATVVGRYQVTADSDVADSASETVILTVAQPFANHNGGQLAFGPDGYLYIGMGDGGGAGDPLGNGQNPDSLLGKILRIDVESGTAPYGVPPDNPFVGQAGRRGEIWATGLRNPWRFSFDRATGDLFIADVGQDSREEIDFQPEPISTAISAAGAFGPSGEAQRRGNPRSSPTHPIPFPPSEKTRRERSIWSTTPGAASSGSSSLESRRVETGPQRSGQAPGLPTTRTAILRRCLSSSIVEP